MNVVIPSSYGFCNGVRTALEKAEAAVAEAGRLGLPCYLYGSIVHNRVVAESFSRRGIRTILSPEGVVPGIVVIRTHGIADSIRNDFVESGFILVDATCPVVLRNMERLRTAAPPAVIVGKKGHSEIEALHGARPDAAVIGHPSDLASLPSAVYSAAIQTTLSLPLLDEIRKEAGRRGIAFNELNSICGASEARRNALSAIAPSVDAFVVVGDSGSANSRELHDLAASCGKPSYLVMYPEELPLDIFRCGSVGLTAGASTPDELFQEVKKALESGREP